MAGSVDRAVHVCALLALVFLSDFLPARQCGPSSAYSKQVLGTTHPAAAPEAATRIVHFDGGGGGRGGHPPTPVKTLTTSPPGNAASSSAIPTAPGLNSGGFDLSEAPASWGTGSTSKGYFVSDLASNVSQERPASVLFPRSVYCSFPYRVQKRDKCTLLIVRFFFGSKVLFAKLNGGIPCISGVLDQGRIICIPPPSSRICAWGALQLTANDTCSSVVAKYFRGQVSLFNSYNAPFVCSDPKFFMQGRLMCLPSPSTPPTSPPPYPQPLPSPPPPELPKKFGFAPASFFAPRFFRPFFTQASFRFVPEENTWLTLGRIDWRTSGKVGAVRDQGPCSSCWAVAAVGAVESAIAIVAKLPSAPRLSVQELVSCQGSFGCGGGLPSAGLDFMVSRSAQGLMTEAQFPYTASSLTQCKNGTVPLAFRGMATAFEQVDFLGWYGVLLAVAKQPVVVNVMGSYPSFQNFRGSYIYSDLKCTDGTLDHSVLVVGYVLQDAQPHWIVRNSWGVRWGDGGDMRMAITGGTGICGIHAMPALYPVILNGTSPCASGVNPCGGGTCVPQPGTSRFTCECLPSFAAVTNGDGTQSCVIANPCAFMRNPCGGGTCVSDNGAYACVCPRGFSLSKRALDGTPTCMPDPQTLYLTNYTVKQQGLTCAVLASTFSLTTATLLQLNPQFQAAKCNDIPVNATLKVQGPIPLNCTVRFSWGDSDSCDSIAKSLNISVNTIGALNPWIDCTAQGNPPNSGQQICVSNQPAVDASFHICTQYYDFRDEDTCDTVIKRFRIPPLLFFAINPGIYCNRTEVKRMQVCVAANLAGFPPCSVPNQRIRVRVFDTCEGILARYFPRGASQLASLNGNFQCLNARLSERTRICVPGFSRPPTASKKQI